MPINYLPHPSQPWPAMDPLEHMFEKSLTPSDVGKLNRLVIPKQHAEKYFPLTGEPADKGLLLNFEDESGKPWRFRYSYWTSSQSYVLTKGWSRYVKEKRLDAGDVVVFQRCHADQLLYIGYRRRGELQNTIGSSSRVANAVVPWSQMFYNCSTSSPHNLSIGSPVQQDCHLHEGQMAGVDHGTSTSAKPLNTKRVRLFGVNLD